MTKELTTTKTFAPFFRDYMDYYEEMSKGDWYEFTGLVFNACFKGIYPDVEAIKSKRVKLYWSAVKSRIKANNYKYANRKKNEINKEEEV